MKLSHPPPYFISPLMTPMIILPSPFLKEKSSRKLKLHQKGEEPRLQSKQLLFLIAPPF